MAINAKPSRQSVRPLVFLLPHMMIYKRAIVCAVVALLTAAAATLALPLTVRQMIDFGFNPQNSDLIDGYFVMLIGVSVILAAASATRYYFVIWIGERIIADVRAQVFAHILKLSPAFFDKGHSGEIVSRLSADTTQIKSAVGASASIALRNILLFIGAVIMMVVTSPWLSAYVLIAIPLIVLPLVGFGRLVRRRSRTAQDSLADATAYASEAVSSARTLQAYTFEDHAAQRYRREVENAFDAARASTMSRAFLTLCIIMLVFSSIVSILWFGAKAVLVGELSVGILSQFVLYSVLAAGAMSELSQVWGELSLAAGATERLVELLRIPSDIQELEVTRPLPVPVSGAVRFDNVTFAYPSAPENPVIKNISFAVSPGETVAIVGPSGAGKSTLFQLLMRFYDPDQGQVSLENINVRDAKLREIRSSISLVAQDPIIFAATAAENIAIGNPAADVKDIKRAAKAALADDFIQQMADDYHSAIGERGATLSGGQRQRIAIARAILKQAPILLLDEATSSLDAESEALVQAALDNLIAMRTTIVIAHRLATVINADRILVLDDGQIVEQGTHRGLIKLDGLYARLSHLQFDQTSSGTGQV